MVIGCDKSDVGETFQNHLQMRSAVSGVAVVVVVVREEQAAFKGLSFRESAELRLRFVVFEQRLFPCCAWRVYCWLLSAIAAGVYG